MIDKICTLKSDNERLSYRIIESGHKPVILLIHGWATSKKFWYPFITRFKDSFNIIIPDVPNFGGSKITPSYSLVKAAESVSQLIRKQSAVDYIIGHSMGGAITTILISKFQAKPKRALLANPVIVGNLAINPANRIITKFPLRNILYFFYRFELARFLISKDYQNIKHLSNDVAIDMRSQSFKSLLDAYSEILNLNLLDELNKITVPIKIIMNSKDPVISQRHNNWLAANMSHEFVILKGQIHCPMYSNPEFFDICNNYFSIRK